MKFVFKIAVAQKSRTRLQALEGVHDPNRPLVPAVQPHPYLVKFWPNYANSLKFAQKPNFLCSTHELVDKILSRLKKGLKTICPYLGIFDSNQPINSSKINIFEDSNLL